MARRNIVASLVIAAFGIWYFVLIQELPERTSMPNTPGPAFFPTVIVTVLLALSAILAASGVIAIRNSTGTGESWLPKWQATIAVGAFLAFLAALPFAGFILSSVVFFAILMRLYGCRNWVLIACAAIAVPVALFTLFRYGFQIVLPRGLVSL
ncbi:MAG: tripartite tricarboxylate transporter TctB family protein [Albidovulum sp.]|nr:tripartite tricarboxylate transporter TctB family protein [Albidovulum sp.]MDE0306124.1 tripartite tricarboxylate transporter TctB family protein [Albidovulum sp.]MDE0531833.1 tripartite tricarboxylate transporter TctB family protein [Albidovulum sp.]